MSVSMSSVTEGITATLGKQGETSDVGKLFA